MSTYKFSAHAFKHEGRCDICDHWTYGGVRESGRVAFRHLCVGCARDRFAGEIVAGLRARAGESERREGGA